MKKSYTCSRSFCCCTFPYENTYIQTVFPLCSCNHRCKVSFSLPWWNYQTFSNIHRVFMFANFNGLGFHLGDVYLMIVGSVIEQWTQSCTLHSLIFYFDLCPNLLFSESIKSMSLEGLIWAWNFYLKRVYLIVDCPEDWPVCLCSFVARPFVYSSASVPQEFLLPYLLAIRVCSCQSLDLPVVSSGFVKSTETS